MKIAVSVAGLGGTLAPSAGAGAMDAGILGDNDIVGVAITDGEMLYIDDDHNFVVIRGDGKVEKIKNCTVRFQDQIGRKAKKMLYVA